MLKYAYYYKKDTYTETIHPIDQLAFNASRITGVFIHKKTSITLNLDICGSFAV